MQVPSYSSQISITGQENQTRKKKKKKKEVGGTYEPVLVEHLNGGEHLGDIKTETELVVRGNPPLLDLFLAAQQGLGNDCGGDLEKEKERKVVRRGGFHI